MAAVAPDLVELVVLGDSLVRAGRTTPEELVEIAKEWDGKGARRARRAAGLVRRGVDSPMESRLRMLIVLAGYPEPTVNVIIRQENGDWRIRLDLSYPHLKLVIEYDGWQHRLDRGQWSSDLKRREWLAGRGWRVVVINADAFYGDPVGTLLRIREAMLDRGERRLPLRPPAVWVRQFAKPDRTNPPPVELSTRVRLPEGGKSPLVEFLPAGSWCREGESNPYVLADRRV